MKIPLIICIAFCACHTVAQNPPKVIPARSAGKLPAIAYGLGSDRLGGARMGYIDTNVLFYVIDSTQDMYQVQLSKYHSAYMEKQFLRFDSLPAEKPFYLINSIVAKPDADDAAYDKVVINTEQRLPYKTRMEINPSRIIVEVFGAQSNINWIGQLQSLKEVKGVYYDQTEDDVVKITVDLKHQQHWGYTISYTGNTLVLRVKHQPSLDVTKLKIGIDAGHGGSNMGTDGVRTELTEKTFTLIFAKALESYLKQRGVKNIVMTRRKDTTFDNKDRILFMQEENPDIVISLHFNSSDDPQTKGVSTYYKHIGFKPLTASILKRMLDIRLDDFGNVGNFNFMLNQPTDFVNCLVEIAFLTNRQDEKRVASKAFPALVAKQIYLGILDWLKAAKVNV